jgi:hypothetical protein
MPLKWGANLIVKIAMTQGENNMRNEQLTRPGTPFEIEIVELDERLDMAFDPLASTITINGRCDVNTGCNAVAGCSGGGKPPVKG